MVGPAKLIESFIEGFNQVVSKDCLSVFNDPVELEFVICGTPIIMVEDWRQHTIYKNGLSDNSKVVEWFWEILT